MNCPQCRNKMLRSKNQCIDDFEKFVCRKCDVDWWLKFRFRGGQP